MFKKFLITGVLIIISSLTAIAISQAIAVAWQEPTQAPPGGNIGAGGGVLSSQWTTSGSDILYNIGNVGIGLTKPDSKPDPKYKITTSNGGIKAENNDFYNPAGYFSNSGGGPALFADGSFKASSIVATQRISSAFGTALYTQNAACPNAGTIVTNGTCGENVVKSLSEEHTEANDAACYNWCKSNGYPTVTYGSRPKGSCLCSGKVVSMPAYQNTILGRLIFDNSQVLPSVVTIDAPVFDSTNNLISISWTPPSTPVTSYRVYRRTDTSPLQLVAEVGKGNLPLNSNYNDTAVNPGTPYYYRVSVVNAEGEGAKSVESQGAIFGIRLITNINTGAITIKEGGTQTEFWPNGPNQSLSTDPLSIKLNYKPIGNVVVKVVWDSGDADISMPLSDTYTFTPGNWNTPQIVTLSATNDPDAINGLAVISISSSSGGLGQNIIEPISTVNITATESDRNIVFLNSGTGTSCVDVCKANELPSYNNDAFYQSGLSCELVGTNIDGSSGVLRNWSPAGCANFSADCNKAIVKQNNVGTCSSSNTTLADAHNVAWTNCRCAKWPALGTVTLSGTTDGSANIVWSYNSVSNELPVTHFRIYKRSSSDPIGSEKLYTTVTNDQTSLNTSTVPGINNYFRVSAVNSNSTGPGGSPLEGPKSNEIKLF